VIEDDYLSELQLKGRATPARASLDRAGCVIHIGSFSKTLTPALRLGFVVAPAHLAGRFAEVAACLAPAPGPAVQLATAEFMRDGHYMRHLRRTKRVYAAQADALAKYFRARARSVTIAGLAAILRLPDGAPDLSIARETVSFGLAPTPLSLWYASTVSARSGLLLGIATSPQQRIEAYCDRLFGIIDRFV
jgi:GntR family transcriptional regulator/MocR family aminotransferase